MILLNIAPPEIDQEIESTLKGIVDFFRVTHSVLIKETPEERKGVITHAARAKESPATPLVSAGDLSSLAPWTAKMLAQGATIRVSTLDDLPALGALFRYDLLKSRPLPFIIRFCGQRVNAAVGG